MTAREMQDILFRKYGIRNMDDLDRAIAETPKPDLRILTDPLPGKKAKQNVRDMREVAM